MELEMPKLFKSFTEVAKKYPQWHESGSTFILGIYWKMLSWSVLWNLSLWGPRPESPVHSVASHRPEQALPTVFVH